MFRRGRNHQSINQSIMNHRYHISTINHSEMEVTCTSLAFTNWGTTTSIGLATFPQTFQVRINSLRWSRSASGEASEAPLQHLANALQDAYQKDLAAGRWAWDGKKKRLEKMGWMSKPGVMVKELCAPPLLGFSSSFWSGEMRTRTWA